MRNRPEFQGFSVLLSTLLLFFSVAFDLEAILTNRTPAKDIQRQRSRAQIDMTFLLKCSTRTYWGGTYSRVRKPQFRCCSRELPMIQSSLSPGNYFVMCFFLFWLVELPFSLFGTKERKNCVNLVIFGAQRNSIDFRYHLRKSRSKWLRWDSMNELQFEKKKWNFQQSQSAMISIQI